MRCAPFTAIAVCAAAPAAATTPHAAFDSLLAADRAASAAAAKADLVSGVAAMLADDVIMPVPEGAVAKGKNEVLSALRADAGNMASIAEWTPVSGGISADGTQGYTFGHMTVRRPGGPDLPFKYLAYWAKRGDDWRVIAYKRVRRAAGEAPAQLIAPVLPEGITTVAARADGSLRRAERAFSDEAQEIGLRAAFERYGRPTSINLGSGAGFTLGAEAISQDVAGPEPTSPFRWSSEGVIVAGSGDLGVSYGMIRRNAPAPEGVPDAFSFFTIWQRPDPSQPWRYIAE